MARSVPALDPTPTFRAEVEARLGRAPNELEVEVLAHLAQAAVDAETLDVDPDLPPVLGGRGELRFAFGSSLPEALARLRSSGGTPVALEAWGGCEFQDEAEAFALGAGLPSQVWAGSAGEAGALALGFRSTLPSEAAPGALLLRVRGEPMAEALALGSQARGLEALDLAPSGPAELVDWARRRGRGLQAEWNLDEGWGFAVVEAGAAAAVRDRLRAWGLTAVEAGRLTAGGSVALHGGPAGGLDLPLELDLGIAVAPFPDRPRREPPLPPGLASDLTEDEVEPVFHALGRAHPVDPPAEAHWRSFGEDGDLALRLAAAPHLMALDPFWGAASILATAAQGLACVGAEALGVAVALPSDVDPSALLGLRQACASLDLRVVQARRLPGLGAPVVAAFGGVDAGAGPVDVEAPEARGLTGAGPKIAGLGYRRAFDGLFLLGERRGELGGSRVLDLRGGADTCPEPWLDEAFRLQACVREGVRLGLFRSAHGVGRGGLLMAALEGSVASNLGCHLLLAREGLRLDALCFGEAPGRVLITTSGEGESALRTLARTHRVPFAKVGVVGGDRFTVAVDGAPLMDVAMAELERPTRRGGKNLPEMNRDEQR